MKIEIFSRRAASLFLGLAGLGLCAALLHLPACAAPAAADAAASAALPGTAASAAQLDPVMKLLEERGMVDVAGIPNPKVRQMRETASDLVFTAMNFIGVRYRRGGNSADTGFDCSGFTRHIFESSVGLILPRRADEQANAPGLLRIDQADLRPGDLVFFNTLRRTFSHVGIYVGDGKFIHSPRSGQQVRVEDMRQSYWLQRFNGARRAPQTGAGGDSSRRSSATGNSTP